MPGTGPAGFELGDLEAIAEMIEENLYALHEADTPGCEEVLDCPLEHFEDGEQKRVLELKALLKKTDEQIMVLRKNRPMEEING